MSRVRVNAMPRPEGTTARLHQPDTHYDGSPRHICVVEFEQLSVQFDSPEDALAWLAWCADHVREALRAQGGSPEPTNEDSLLAEVLDLQARLDHYDGWFGDDCRCDEIPCPLTLPAVTARPRPVTA